MGTGVDEFRYALIADTERAQHPVAMATVALRRLSGRAVSTEDELGPTGVTGFREVSSKTPAVADIGLVVKRRAMGLYLPRYML